MCLALLSLLDTCSDVLLRGILKTGLHTELDLYEHVTTLVVINLITNIKMAFNFFSACA